jgi:uncharacterized membrane protein YqiK
LVENLPAIIHESVKPMERIDSIKILQVDGMPGFSNGANGGPATSPPPEGSSPADGIGRGANLAESVVNSALRYRAQAPFVETLLHEIGMSTQSMNLEGLQGLSKADYSGAKPVLDKPPRTSGN